jgi:hypothetical protein
MQLPIVLNEKMEWPKVSKRGGFVSANGIVVARRIFIERNRSYLCYHSAVLTILDETSPASPSQR